MKPLRICTYNIHKGFSQFNRRMVIHDLRDRLRSLDADIVFLQEVQGPASAGTHSDIPTGRHSRSIISSPKAAV